MSGKDVITILGPLSQVLSPTVEVVRTSVGDELMQELMRAGGVRTRPTLVASRSWAYPVYDL